MLVSFIFVSFHVFMSNIKVYKNEHEGPNLNLHCPMVPVKR